MTTKFQWLGLIKVSCLLSLQPRGWSIFWIVSLSSISGFRTAHPLISGFPDSFSLKHSSLRHFRTSLENTSSLLTNLISSVKFMMKSRYTKSPRNQKTVLTFMECTWRVQDGTQLPTFLTILNLNSYTQKCRLSGSFQRETERSQKLASTSVLYTKCVLDQARQPLQDCQQTTVLCSSSQVTKNQMLGPEQEWLSSLPSDTEHSGLLAKFCG